MEREGGCACGGIRFRITAPFTGVGACHCTDCQKAAGGGANYVALTPKDALTVTKGEPKLFRKHGDADTAGSRAFCPDCGTPLWGIPRSMPFLTVSLGALDNRDDLAPQIHIYTSSAPEWHHFGEGLPRFEKMPPAG